ncbi:MAG: hypothetical protein INR73_10100 [Williamsia sp.]|nr:hypothetical protein [Williamsia sp.]
MIENPSETQNPIKALFAEGTDYLKNKRDLLKLKAVDKSSDVISSVIEGVALFFISIFFIILFSIALALLVGSLIGSNWGGFFIIAGLYALIGLILHVSRNKLIKAPVVRALIKKFLN